jgi:hypothetical protein
MTTLGRRSADGRSYHTKEVDMDQHDTPTYSAVTIATDPLKALTQRESGRSSPLT